jgi:uncharacterized protein (DUF2147 family)
MKVIGIIVLTMLAILPSGTAYSSEDTVRGFWLTANQRAIIEISACGEQTCGKIVWLAEPLDADGRPKIDRNNPEEALRDRPLCRIQLIAKFRNDGFGRWLDGSIYNPRDGRTYLASMELGGANTLELRGYLLLPVFGQTEVWTRENGARGGCC